MTGPSPHLHLEIERKYLLDALPALPAGATSVTIEQGYLPEPAATDGGGTGDGTDEVSEGRVRRTIAADGDASFTHTIKSGSGLTRTEIERAITAEQFERAWAGTAGRRVRKTRHRVPDRTGDVPLLWEIDDLRDLDLVLAEVELPSETTPVVLPSWLARHVIREVTDDRGYRNFALATHGVPARPGAGDSLPQR